MLTDKLKTLLKETQLQLTDQQVKLLIDYVELLNKWNKTYNLTSIRDPQDMIIKHIMDSLMIGPLLEGQYFIDVGTGPGLPGIPLAIAYPDKEFVLLDSLGKRITFLKQVTYQLSLKNVTPIQSRVEKYQPEKPFDGVLSRAFSSLNDMVTWCDHLVSKDHGKFLALKGQFPTDEIENLPTNVKMIKSHTIIVPQLNAERHLIELVKIQ
ncbi:16S rRNA (guanine(527)-N(7))-methyltransferase RsmG [Colwellia sp. RE-S-Sl-9]